MVGTGSLRSRQDVIDGEVVDISLTGIALRVDGDFRASSGLRSSWLCWVSSPDLPDDLCFLARVVRMQRRRSDNFIACRIIDINSDNGRKLKAYRALAMARGNPVFSAAEGLP
jgi:PilZ domain